MISVASVPVMDRSTKSNRSGIERDKESVVLAGIPAADLCLFIGNCAVVVDRIKVGKPESRSILIGATIGYSNLICYCDPLSTIVRCVCR